MLTINEKYINEYGKYYWEIIHLEALKITLDEINDKINLKKREDFLAMFEYIIRNMMCMCKNHAYQLFMINNYSSNYKYIFQYTVDFHNQVNEKLGKKIYSYNEAILKYKPFIENV